MVFIQYIGVMTMKLSVPELLNKFPYLKKFQDQKWIFDATIDGEISSNEIPLHCCLMMIQDLLKFLDKTKFNNNWEGNFSTKTRVEQIETLLLFFCEDYQIVKSKKSNL